MSRTGRLTHMKKREVVQNIFWITVCFFLGFATARALRFTKLTVENWKNNVHDAEVILGLVMVVLWIGLLVSELRHTLKGYKTTRAEKAFYIFGIAISAFICIALIALELIGIQLCEVHKIPTGIFVFVYMAIALLYTLFLWECNENSKEKAD